jgi:hypothetical protein
MDTFVTAAVLIGAWVYVSRSGTSNNDNAIRKAIDPITGNPAIVDPPLRAGIGNDLNTHMPYLNYRNNQLIKPFDKNTTDLFQSSEYANDYNMAWSQNVWESGNNSTLDTDTYVGNGMIPYYSDVVSRMNI